MEGNQLCFRSSNQLHSAGGSNLLFSYLVECCKLRFNFTRVEMKSSGGLKKTGYCSKFLRSLIFKPHALFMKFIAHIQFSIFFDSVVMLTVS